MQRGFTLFEIVLAIGLTAVVIYLLTTAIEHYLVRVDTSRARVESAQLARTILDQIATDLSAAQYSTPASSIGTALSGTAAGGVSGVTAEGPSTSSRPSSLGDASNVQGIYGDVDDLRIDASTPRRSHYIVRAANDADDEPQPEPMTTVRYYYVDGERLSSADRAAQGVADRSAKDIAGLYRQQAATSEVMLHAQTSDNPFDQITDAAELLAPEVVGLELKYFDGAELVDSWDAAEDQGLPKGVEILLKVLEDAYRSDDDVRYADRNQYQQRDVKEYRRFVALPAVREPREAEMLAKPSGNGESVGTSSFGDAANGAGNENGGGDDGDE